MKPPFRECDYQATQKRHLTEHQEAKHEGDDVVEKYRNFLDVDDQEEIIPDLWRSFGGDDVGQLGKKHERDCLQNIFQLDSILVLISC